jgi:pyridoxal phosphate enzyme (YggS family)
MNIDEPIPDESMPDKPTSDGPTPMTSSLTSSLPTDSQSESGIEGFRQRYAGIQSRIEAACQRSGRRRDEIEVVWVGKTHARERLLQAQAAGARLFGENRVQEVLAKFPLEPGAELHLIGHLQKNKARKILPLCACIQSVDSWDLWDTLERLCEEMGCTRDVLLQINTSGEDAKSGFSEMGFEEILKQRKPSSHLRLRGLMTMGPTEGGAEAARPGFQRLAQLLKSLRANPEWSSRFPQADKLSMGMSGDFEIAIEEGAHWVRVGTALFGSR